MAKNRLVILTVFALAGGCAAERKLGQWDGPQTASNVQTGDWSYLDQPARCIATPHYRIYTTLKNDDLVRQLPQTMEGALVMYRALGPAVPVSGAPMDCYIFQTRGEWEKFTARFTGPDARVYLRIRGGGYTVRDKYVSYYSGPVSTLAVAAHEGWHQYVGRNFIGRLPPFLEEGISCMFEAPDLQGKLPRWNLSINPTRAHQLRKAIEGEYLWPLEKLVTMHAGEIVTDRIEKIDAFYAQSWAFAKFLWEADNARHRPALARWLAETATGQVYDPTKSHTRAGLPWNRKGIRPMVEHYLGMPFEEIDRAYQVYLQRVAYQEFALQWRS